MSCGPPGSAGAGGLDSALAEARAAHELDPLNAAFSERVARHLYFLRRYPEAEAMYRRNLRDYPAGGRYGGVAAVYRAEGRTRDALEVMRTERERKGDSAGAARIPVASSDTQAARMLADLARERLRALAEAAGHGEEVEPSDWVSAYAGVGNVGETIALDRLDAGPPGSRTVEHSDRSGPRLHPERSPLPGLGGEAAVAAGVPLTVAGPRPQKV